MLQDIREKAQGWIAWAIVILISIPFALWGVNSYFGSGASVTVMEINGTEVERGEFQQLYQQQRRQFEALLGNNSGQVSEEMLRESVLEGIIRNQLLLQGAADAGFRIGDEQLAARIHAMSEFQSNGAFNKSLYESRLRGGGYSPAGFEASLRSGMLTDQVETGITVTEFATPLEVDDALRMRDQRRQVGFLTVAADSFTDQIIVSDGDIEQYYNDNRDHYVTEEQVKVSYLELSVDSIAAQLQPTDAALKAYYEAYLDSYRTDGARRAAHILIQADPKDEEAMAAARQKAEDLLAQLRDGADFGALAQANSDDPGSAGKGGDLGFFGRGVMDPAFEEAVYGLQPEEISEPVETAFGVHIIKLLNVRPGATKSFEDALDQVRRDYARHEAETEFYEKAETLTNLAYEQPDSLQPAADALGMSVQGTDWFGREGGTGITGNPRVVEAAFSDEVLNGNNSEVLELDANHYLVLRVQEHRPSAPQPLETVREDIRATLVQVRAEERARELGQQVLTAIRGGQAPEAAAAEHSLKWQPPATVGRNAPELDPAVLRTAFAMPRPQPGASTTDGVSLPDGDYAVVVLTGVIDGDPAAADAGQRRRITQQLVRGFGDNDYLYYNETLRADAEVVIRRDNL